MSKLVALAVISAFLGDTSCIEIASHNSSLVGTTTRKPELPSSIAASCSRNYQFDYFVFSLQWPLSFCYEKLECNLQIARQKRWLIHGLWPNRGSFARTKRNQGSTPSVNTQKRGSAQIQFCCGDQYNSSMINSQTYKELVTKWPTLNANGKHHSFWRHEWQKHGTCAKQVSSLKNQTAYFETVLALYSRFDLNSLALRSNHTYSLQEVHRLVEPRVANRKVRIECSLAQLPSQPLASSGVNSTNITNTAQPQRKPSNAVPKVSIFAEVHICLDKLLQPIDCQRKDDHQCKRDIHFP